jgi:hypothetical protein
MLTKAFIRGRDFLIDHKILPGDTHYQAYANNGAGNGALVHDFKQLKHLLVALGVAAHMDHDAFVHSSFYPQDKAMPIGHLLPAVVKRNDDKVEGGIDFNTRQMKFNAGGDEIKFNFNPAMAAEFMRGDFSGVSARIMSILPIADVRPMLGLKKEDELLAVV